MRLLWGGECVLFLLEKQMWGSGRKCADSLWSGYSGTPSSESKGVCCVRSSYHVWCTWSRNQSLPSKIWGPLWLGEFVLSFLVRVRWHSVSCGQKYSSAILWAACGVRMTAVCWERRKERGRLDSHSMERESNPSLWVLVNALNTDLCAYLQNGTWMWRGGWCPGQEFLPVTVACRVLFELVLRVRAHRGSCQILESPESEWGKG